MKLNSGSESVKPTRSGPNSTMRRNAVPVPQAGIDQNLLERSRGNGPQFLDFLTASSASIRVTQITGIRSGCENLNRIVDFSIARRKLASDSVHRPSCA